jgi:hypothetical protein
MHSDLTIVLTPDTREAAIAAETASCGRPGFVVIDVPPSTKRDLADVADAVLVGLGKDERLSVIRRAATPLAAAWLSLGEHTDAVVWDAGQLSDQLLDETVEWLASFGIHTWLHFTAGPWVDTDGTAERIDRLADGWAAEVVTSDDLASLWPEPTQPIDEPAEDLPVLPRIDGTLFRSTMRDTLEPEAFAVVDARYCALVVELRSELRELTGTNKTRRFEQLLRNRMHDTGPVEDLHLLARAAQVAGLIEGFHVAVNPVMLFGGSATVPRRGQAGPGRWWVKLDAYRDPDIGAVAALFLAGVDIEDLRKITLDMIEIGDDVTVATPGRDLIVVPEPGARFVRALVTWRHLSGGGSDFLLVNHRTDAVSQSYASAVLQTPMETGVIAAAVPVRPVHPSPKAWLARFGITISKTTYTAVTP